MLGRWLTALLVNCRANDDCKANQPDDIPSGCGGRCTLSFECEMPSGKRGSSHTEGDEFPGGRGIFLGYSLLPIRIICPGGESTGVFDIRNRGGASVCLERGGDRCWDFAKGKS